jgi:hypothetical protein
VPIRDAESAEVDQARAGQGLGVDYQVGQAGVAVTPANGS